jgi:hypothetical protein
MPALLLSTSSMPCSGRPFSDDVVAVVGVRDVGPNREAPSAERLDRCLGLFELLDTARADRDVSARVSQARGERDAQPGRAAGDDHDLSSEGRTSRG